MTPYQKQNLADFERTKYGEMHCNGRILLTIWSLVEKGMLENRTAGWFRITQRGKDYLRFGTRKRRA